MNQNWKILVVDDEEIMRDLLKDYLEMSDYEVDVAENGQLALDMIVAQYESNPYSLVITDINMPVMGGIDLQKNIKNLYPELPVVFMTGYGVETVRKELEGHARGFLGKPFELPELVELLDDILK